MPDLHLTALPVASLIDAGTIAVLIPIVALTIPIVAILSAHQRKMAEIMHRSQAVPTGELEAIKQELRELRGLMHQHTIALDDVRNKQSIQRPNEMQERLGTQ